MRARERTCAGVVGPGGGREIEALESADLALCLGARYNRMNWWRRRPERLWRCLSGSEARNVLFVVFRISWQTHGLWCEKRGQKSRCWCGGQSTPFLCNSRFKNQEFQQTTTHLSFYNVIMIVSSFITF